MTINDNDVKLIASKRGTIDPWERSMSLAIREFQEKKRHQERVKKQALREFNLGKISTEKLMEILIEGEGTC